MFLWDLTLVSTHDFHEELTVTHVIPLKVGIRGTGNIHILPVPGTNVHIHKNTHPQTPLQPVGVDGPLIKGG